MADIDLIPTDYREWLKKKAMVPKYLAAALLANALLVLGGFVLAAQTEQQQSLIANLLSQNTVTQNQQTQLQQLHDQYAEFERQWSLLRGLQAGVAVNDIFVIIDRSIGSGDLWFTDWSFRRAGVVIDGQQRGVETGYFIIVDDKGGSTGNSNLFVETHMTIHGQARDHQALSKFVRALFDEQDIKDVNVQKTSQTDYANGRVVEFDMTVVLSSVFRES